jgi:hypothetical protein
MAEFIKVEEAVKLTHAFQNSEIGNGQTISVIFEKEILAQILNQEDCKGLRIYNALNEEGKITYVIVGYDNKKDDIYDGYIADHGEMCPPNCPSSKSPLNAI